MFEKTMGMLPFASRAIASRADMYEAMAKVDEEKQQLIAKFNSLLDSARGTSRRARQAGHARAAENSLDPSYPRNVGGGGGVANFRQGQRGQRQAITPQESLQESDADGGANRGGG